MVPADAHAERLLGALDRALTGVGVDVSAERLLLADLRRRCGQPLRVAVVGQVKAGKSTLMNALAGEDILPTGLLETTYNVAWLRHGAEARARVCWADGRPATDVGIGAVVDLIHRQNAGPDADSVAWIEVSAPLQILNRIELIDTPGLASSYSIDSRKTALFLNLDRSGPPTEIDVAAFMLRRNMHEQDAAAIRSFRQRAEGRLSPLNALAVIGQVDLLWPGVDDPWAAARAIGRRLMSRPELGNTLNEILPTAATLARAADRLGPAERDALAALAALPPGTLDRALASSTRFVSAETSFTGDSAVVRAALLEALGLYGVSLACRLTREVGVEAALARVRQESGVPALLHRLEELAPRAGFLRVSAARFDLEDAGGRLAHAGALEAAKAWRTALDRYFDSPEILAFELLRFGACEDLDLAEAEIEDIRLATQPSARVDPGLRDRRRSYWRARFNEARLLGSRAEAPARAMSRYLEACGDDS